MNLKIINAYGGMLRYTVQFALKPNVQPMSISQADVLISGNNMTIAHYSESHPSPGVSLSLQVPLVQYNFVHYGTNSPISREQFMMILTSIESLQIRASHYTSMTETSLSDVSLEVASESGTGSLANSVEKCQCPPNYRGLSCEECSPGYYRVRTPPFLGICLKCNCNGHSDTCDVETGECFNCQDHTTGPHCEQCLAGYYGDPTIEGCQICSCPLPILSNNFATSCVVNDYDATTVCSCLPGYDGQTCERCASGYYGDPYQPGSNCQPCRCSGNIDVKNPDSCDRLTGQCLLCQNNTAGETCNYCRDWYFGDAVYRKDCQACACDTCGTDKCDRDSGACLCKDNVEGARCEKCAENTWGYDYCTGCKPCECGVGSVTGQCNLQTGVCSCLPGVEGEKCDKCKPYHWNYGINGCQACDCLSNGTVGCDAETGKCQCLPGVTGDQCDRCQPRWVLVPNRGCQECDYCVHLLMDDLDVMAKNMTIISRELGEVSVGAGAYSQLSHYNKIVADYRPQVDNMSYLTPESIKEQVNDLNISAAIALINVKTFQGTADVNMYEAKEIPGSIQNLTKSSANSEASSKEFQKYAKETVEFIQNVGTTMMETSTNRNNQKVLEDSERIVTEISGLDFDAQNKSSYLEAEAAMNASEDVKKLKAEAMMNDNKTSEYLTTINDISSRLRDLLNNSQYSSQEAENAKNTIKRLKAVHLNKLKQQETAFDQLTQERVVSIKEADELLTEANMKLDGAEKFVEGINNETANLNGNLPNLNGSVEALGDSLMPSSEKVNKSLVHLQMLKQQAETFQIVEYDSKNTENALEAVKAYKTIINNIEEAQMKANSAVVDSPLLTINEFDVTPTLEKSEMLANESEEQTAQNRDLNETLKSAINSVNMAEKKNADVDKLLKVVLGELEDIQKISSGNESAATMQIVSDVAAKVDAIEKLSEQVNEDKLSNQLKKDFILQNRPKILGDMAQIEQNINLANESIPEVQSLLNNLTQRSASLSKESSDLTLSVELLRRRIEEARDEAKRIKVGLSFLGNTTVTLRSPPELENTASKTKISFTIKTNSTDALLVYIGPNTLSQPAQPRQQRSVQGKMDPDFMALELKEGRILFTYNLGSGSARIHSDIQVNNAEVYKVIAERIGKSGNLTVFSNKTKEVVVTKGSSQGPYVVLELDPAKTHFMLGGVSSMVQIPQELTTRFFFGEIQHLMFEEKHLGLWNFAAGENNYHGVKQEIVILPDYKLQGVAFDGQGYAVFENKHNTANRTRATFTIKTFAEDGLILYMGGVRDFLSLEMRKGKFFFQFDLGGGVYTLETQNTYNNGRWHVIYIDRSLKTAVVNINNKEEDLKISAEGNLQTLETGRLAFIGGLDFFNMTHPVTKTGFKGCMKDITLGNIPENPLKSGRSKGVQEGCILDKNSASFISSRSSYVAFDEVSVGETFELTFKMKTTEPEALLVYVSDKTQTNTLAVSVFNGMIVVTQELGAVPVRLNSKSSSYNDGSWHYIQIIKERERLTLTVDDREIIQDSSDSVELITNTKVYFGGVASDYTITSTVVPTKLSLTGCIGDITINKMYYGFENAEYNGITLDCPTEKIDETKIESDVPVVCKLPQVGSTEDEKGEFIGKCFGTESRQEFGKYKSHPSLSTIEVTFKTEAENGLILYSADQKHVDFLAIYIANGSVYFGFNCGSGTAKVKSPIQYNDAQWHKVVAERNRNIGTLFIDGNQVASGRSGGKALSLNTIEPNYIGGLPQEIRNKTFKNIGDYHGFDGCMTNISLYKGFAEKPKVEFNVTESYSSEELGTYFGSSGGRVTLIDKFKVGRDLNISMEIKPRSANGVLLAVHSNTSDYLILQLVAGELIFTVDNGAGAISTSYRPQTSDYLCDGEWHKIQAYKDRHIIRLSVDGVRPTQVQSSRPDSSSVDTFDPLYIGGVPDGKAKGIITTTHYIGCIRLLALNERVQSIKRGSAVGDVRLGACPKR
ncbi:laminin subunit alpha-like [Physella acuta]|uniref:laminin subunit alpha-like n=1 Tax=Physella acuta TaxID=109671 RepID=UPI0027DD085C|nr:laminin subunit alpha-like [Physella acuta]